MKGKVLSVGKLYSSWPLAVFCSAGAPKLKAPAIQTPRVCVQTIQCLYRSLQSCSAKETGFWHPLLAHQ